MASKLGLYNQALRLLGERRVVDLTEAREPRRVLDDAYDDVVAFCLAQGVWNFALKTAVLSSAGSGALGFTNKFTKPADLIHLFMASLTDNYEQTLLFDYQDQDSYWHANGSSLYVRYTSSHTDFGGNLGIWPAPYTFYVAAVLAANVAMRLTSSYEIARYCEEISQMRLGNALAIYQVDGPRSLLPKSLDANQPARVDGVLAPPRYRPFGAATAEPRRQRREEG